VKALTTVSVKHRQLRFVFDRVARVCTENSWGGERFCDNRIVGKYRLFRPAIFDDRNEIRIDEFREISLDCTRISI